MRRDGFEGLGVRDGNGLQSPHEGTPGVRGNVPYLDCGGGSMMEQLSTFIELYRYVQKKSDFYCV